MIDLDQLQYQTPREKKRKMEKKRITGRRGGREKEKEDGKREK